MSKGNGNLLCTEISDICLDSSKWKYRELSFVSSVKISKICDMAIKNLLIFMELIILIDNQFPTKTHRRILLAVLNDNQ